MAEHKRTVDEVEASVLRHLEDITDIPADKIRLSDNLVRDLSAGSDDLSFVFVPGVERDLGVKVPVKAWESVFTVQDAIDMLRSDRTH